MTIALFRLAFALAPKTLFNLPYLISRRFILQQARGHYSLPQIVGIRFHFLFTPLLGFFFIFPSRYLYTIGYLGVFSFWRWSSLFTQNFTCFMLLRLFNKVNLRDFHPLWCRIQLLQNENYLIDSKSMLFPFRSPLLWKSLLLSFPLLTKMFQFGRLFQQLVYEFDKLYYGLPHSGIFGSKLVSSSPKHIVGATPFIISKYLDIHHTP
jgi:hypothetical protein